MPLLLLPRLRHKLPMRRVPWPRRHLLPSLSLLRHSLRHSLRQLLTRLRHSLRLLTRLLRDGVRLLAGLLGRCPLLVRLRGLLRHLPAG